MARRQRAAGAGRAGRHGEPRPVQLVQQCLPIDIETGEGHQMRQPPHRVADHLHIGHHLRHRGPDAVHQGPQPYGLGRGLGPHGAQRRRRGDDRRNVLETRRPSRLPLVGRSLSGEPHPLAHRQQPDAGGPAPFVGAAHQQRPAVRHRLPAQRLRGVHQQRHPRRPADLRDPGHRLLGADLVIGGLQTGQRGVLAQRVRERRRAHRPRPVHRDLGDRPALRLMGGRRMEHRRVFDRGDDQMAADTPTSRESPGHPRVHRPGPRRGECELVRTASDGFGGGLPGGVQQQPGAPSLAVEPGRVGPALVQRGKQRLTCDGVQGSGGCGVEVGHAATLARTGPGPGDGPPARGRERGRQMALGGPYSTPSRSRAARWAPSPRDAK